MQGSYSRTQIHNTTDTRAGPLYSISGLSAVVGDIPTHAGDISKRDNYLQFRSRVTLTFVDQHLELIGWNSLNASVLLLTSYIFSRTTVLYILAQYHNHIWYSATENPRRDIIPLDTDIWITCPPPEHHFELPRTLGCPHLAVEIKRARPLLHRFGHVYVGPTDLEGWLRKGRAITI